MAKIAVFCLLFAMVAIAHANTVPQQSNGNVLQDIFEPIAKEIKEAATSENFDKLLKYAKEQAEKLNAQGTAAFKALEEQITKARADFVNKA